MSCTLYSCDLFIVLHFSRSLFHTFYLLSLPGMENIMIFSKISKISDIFDIYPIYITVL